MHNLFTDILLGIYIGLGSALITECIATLLNTKNIWFRLTIGVLICLIGLACIR